MLEGRELHSFTWQRGKLRVWGGDFLLADSDCLIHGDPVFQRLQQRQMVSSACCGGGLGGSEKIGGVGFFVLQQGFST